MLRVAYLGLELVVQRPGALGYDDYAGFCSIHVRHSDPCVRRTPFSLRAYRRTTRTGRRFQDHIDDHQRPLAAAAEGGWHRGAEWLHWIMGGADWFSSNAPWW